MNNSYYVSPHGSDLGCGDADNPFASIERALVAVQENKRCFGGEIIMLPGIYSIKHTIALNAADSGVPAEPLRLKAL